MSLSSPARVLRARFRSRSVTGIAESSSTVSSVRFAPLAHVACMAERITAGLWPHSQPMRFRAYRNGFDRASRRINVVRDIVPPSRQPYLLAVGADIAHVGTAAAGDRPGTLDFISC